MTDDFEERLKALTEKLESLAPTVEKAQEAAASINRQILDEQNAWYARLQKLKEEQRNISEDAYKAEREFKFAQQELERLKAEKAAKEAAIIAAQKEAEEAAARAEQEAALTKRFDLATAGAKWREWAKDHQIKGGHKIVMDKNVILADVMGLGKTLTSIITADMAYAVTKEATEEHPFLGEEKTVFKQDQIAKYVFRGLDINNNKPEDWELQGRYDVNNYYGRRYVQDHKNKGLDYGAILTDDYGTNYTYQFYPGGEETIIVNGIERPVGRRILYFCPAPLLRNVREEWSMWAPHRSCVYIGAMTKAERAFALDSLKALPQREFVVIVNYEAWRRDKNLLQELISCDFDTFIIDEAHMIKDMKSQAYTGVETIIFNSNPSYIIPMTGTPVLNRPQELFPLLHLTLPKVFYDINDYLYRYCEQDENNKWYFKPGGLERLSKQISQNFLRRTKHDAGIQLPPQTIIHHDLDIDEENYPDQCRARDHMRKFAILRIGNPADGKAIAATVIIALYTRLRQIETWPAGIVQRDPLTKEIVLQVDVYESQKVDYCIRQDPETKEWEGLIPEGIEDERMVLFSQFKAPLHELADRINKSGKRAVVYDGDTPASLAQEIKHDFDARYTPDRVSSKWDIVLCNYKVGSVGLNLTAASQVIILDEEWNPGKRDQAYGRVDRIGQSLPTTVHVIRMKGTVDEWLADLIDFKEQNVVGNFESKMSELLDPQGFKKGLESGLI